MSRSLVQDLPIATKIFLGINIALFALVSFLPDLRGELALYYFTSPRFQPYQIVTHIFMHGGIAHLLFNMYALVLFGSLIERQLGTKRFCILYFFSAVGAFALHLGIIGWQLSDLPAEVIAQLQTEGAAALAEGKNYIDPEMAAWNIQYNGSIVGASGALMGILAGFAILFPNAKLGIIFLPFSLKAKYFMPIYMLIELTLGVRNFEWDNIGHFAHLGGAISGGLLLLAWMKSRAVVRQPYYEEEE